MSLRELPLAWLEVGAVSPLQLPRSAGPAAKVGRGLEPQPSVSAAPLPPWPPFLPGCRHPSGFGCAIKGAYPRFIAGFCPQGVTNTSLWTLWSLEKQLESRVIRYKYTDTIPQGRGCHRSYLETGPWKRPEKGQRGPLQGCVSVRRGKGLPTSPLYTSSMTGAIPQPHSPQSAVTLGKAHSVGWRGGSTPPTHHHSPAGCHPSVWSLELTYSEAQACQGGKPCYVSFLSLAHT